jgi:hypothetical protein
MNSLTPQKLPAGCPLNLSCRLEICFLVLVILFGASHPAFSAGRAQSGASSERFDRLQRWLVAVAQHEPGSLDDLLPPIGEWSRLDLVDVLDDLKRFRTFLARASNPVRPQTHAFEGHDFTKAFVRARPGYLAGG